MGVELPRQEMECDKCKTYTKKEGDGNYFCHVPGFCPGDETKPERRKALYDRKFLSKFIGLIGKHYYEPGSKRGMLVNTVLKGELLTGRYLIDEEDTLYFVEPGPVRHDDISFHDITYIEKVKS